MQVEKSAAPILCCHVNHSVVLPPTSVYRCSNCWLIIYINGWFDSLMNGPFHYCNLNGCVDTCEMTPQWFAYMLPWCPSYRWLLSKRFWLSYRTTWTITITYRPFYIHIIINTYEAVDDAIIMIQMWCGIVRCIVFMNTQWNVKCSIT